MGQKDSSHRRPADPGNQDRSSARNLCIQAVGSPSDRHIVQIFNADQTHLITTILAIPTIVFNRPENRGLHSMKRPQDIPRLYMRGFIRAINIGQEFPVSQAPGNVELRPPRLAPLQRRYGRSGARASGCCRSAGTGPACPGEARTETKPRWRSPRTILRPRQPWETPLRPSSGARQVYLRQQLLIRCSDWAGCFRSACTALLNGTA